MNNLWESLDKPIICLAPMEGVADTVFRRIVGECGKPDISFTEFTSVDGMYSRGFEFVARRFKYEDVEKPLVAQIWGLEPNNFYKAAVELVKMGFDGIDLNMGCPVHDVTKKGAGGAMVNNMELAGRLIQATQKGAGGKVPVSVKIRIGDKTIVTEKWVKYLLGYDLDALTVHGRTVKEQSKVPAHWDEIGKAVKIRDEMRVKTMIVGNGDVRSLRQVESKVQAYGVDGVMIGRGVLHDPYIFNEKVTFADRSYEEKIELLIRHMELFEKVWGGEKPFHVLRKYFKIYISGFKGAKELRVKLMECEDKGEVEGVLREFSDKIL